MAAASSGRRGAAWSTSTRDRVVRDMPEAPKTMWTSAARRPSPPEAFANWAVLCRTPTGAAARTVQRTGRMPRSRSAAQESAVGRLAPVAALLPGAVAACGLGQAAGDHVADCQQRDVEPHLVAGEVVRLPSLPSMPLPAMRMPTRSTPRADAHDRSPHLAVAAVGRDLHTNLRDHHPACGPLTVLGQGRRSATPSGG
jgi:hypothetical protein